MSWTWRAAPIDAGPAVLVDVDGVISDAGHRQDYVDRGDWDGFFHAAVHDPPIDSLIALLDLLDEGLAVVLLTARPGWLGPATLDWLREHTVRWDLLVMRDGGSYEASRTFKRREVERLREHGLELVLAFEDDLRNVAMLREEGLRVVYVHSGYYE